MSTKRKNRVFAKTHRRIIAGAGMLVLLLFTDCNKLKTKDHMIFSIAAVMPHDGTPVAGVRYRIVEYKYKAKFGKMLGEPSPTGWELHGLTDSYGKAFGNFKGVIKINYEYRIYFDYTNMVLPAGISDYTVDGPEYALLQRSFSEANSYDVRIIPYTSFHFIVKNVNCFDNNDRMRFRTFNYDEHPNYNFDMVFPFSNPFMGCGTHIDNTADHILSGHQVYQIEVTRNGNTTTYIDTFNLLPNQMNEVFIEY